VKKEEFPTFLNEQPTVIFGRTARELLIIACGCLVGYTVWPHATALLPGAGGVLLGIVCAGIPALLSLAVALIAIANRPMEEWFFCWLTYVLIPKLYLYKPLEESMGDFAEEKDEKSKHTRQQGAADDTADAIDED
jgi:hypothetical protein